MLIQDELNKYSDIMAAIENCQNTADAIIAANLPPAAAENIQSLKDKIAELETAAEQVKADIVTLTLGNGETVKGNTHMAVWSKPSAKWNDDALKGYAVTHPEILPFRSVGKPSVSVRTIKKG